MKRIITGSIVMMLLLSLLLIKAPQNVSALNEQSWVVQSGVESTTVDVTTAATTAPAWLQRFSDGIQIEMPAKICYPFRQGAYDWVPEILRLSGETWTQLETSKEYLFGKEAGLYACATPTYAGTFALFAYYHGAAAAATAADTGDKIFTVASWTMRVGTPREQDFGDIYAYDVNWSGYPMANRLAWGIEMCWESADDCHDSPYGYILISNTGLYPYPQNYDVPIFTDSNMSFTGSGGACRMAPFVELLDKKGNVLARVYYESAYANYCVS
jgi:hypothetical protein